MRVVENDPVSQARRINRAAAPELRVFERNESPPTPLHPGVNGENHPGDAMLPAFDAQLAPNAREEFLQAALAEVPMIREQCLAFIKAPASPESQSHLSGLLQRVQLLNTNAAQAGCAFVALLTNVFQALLSKILADSSAATQSALRTMVQAVDCLGHLLENNVADSAEPAFQAKVLVVDDDPICNQVNVASLKRVNIDAVGVDDPLAALSLLENNTYDMVDLVVLDVNMPGMTGFDVCEKMRRLPHCKTTPVIFVTAFSNFDNRKQSVLSGGDDFVSKPVSPLELSLKVTIHLIKAQMKGARTSGPESKSAAGNGSEEAPQPVLSVQPDPEKPPTEQSQGNGELPGISSAFLDELAEAARQAQKGYEEEAARCRKLEQELAGLRQVRVELQSKLTVEQQSAAKTQNEIRELKDRLRQSKVELDGRSKTGVEQQTAERARLESEWREKLDAAKAAAGQQETALNEKDARCRLLEEELTRLRQMRDDLRGKYGAEQKAAAKAQDEIKELQERLSQSKAELEERSKAGQKQQTTEQASLVSEWREQLNTAKTAAGQMETVLKENEARCRQLEEELAGVRQSRDELEDRFLAGQEAVAKSQQEIKDLQELQGQRSAELDRVKAELEQQTAERARLESEWREQLSAATAVAGQTEALLKEKEAWSHMLEEELAALRKSRDELQGKFAAGQEAAAKSQQEIEDLQKLQCQSIADLDRAKTELEQQTAERARLESEWREQLNTAKAAAGQMEALLKENEARCRQLEEELAGLRQVRDDLQGKFAAGQEAAAKSQQEIKELQKLQRQSGAELKRAKADLEEQSAERTRLEAEYRNLVDEKKAMSLELGQLRESQAAREVELRDRQKKLAEALRENILLLQVSLEETEALTASPASAKPGAKAKQR
jgi:DNA-binding response OmpR family regulator